MYNNFDMDVMNKVAVITGAGGFICGEIARELAKAGANTVLLDRNEAAAEKVASAIRDAGGKATAMGCSVLDKAELDEVHKRINMEVGAVDILINGAGGNNPRATCDREYASVGDLRGDFFDLDEAGVRQVFDLNYLGTLLPTQVFARDMIGRSGTCILNISSMNAYRPLTKIPAYSGAKAAISNLTEWLSVHLAKAGIRVNAIAPGFFVTSQNRSLLYDEDGEPTERTKKILTATPMGRFGEIHELMGAVKLLVSSKEAGFITGVVLPIDGGFNAYSGV